MDRLVGTVTDQSGAALRGANVTLTNIGTGERHQTKSGDAGDYQFLNLVPGKYRVEVEQSGFKKATSDNIEVNVSGTARADMAMQLGDVTQSVEVQAAPTALQTENANLSQVVNSRAVEELPVNGRNILNLTALVPGVVPQGTTDGNAMTGKEHLRGRQLPDRRRLREPGRGVLRWRSGQFRAWKPGQHGAQPGCRCGVPRADQQQQLRIRTLLGRHHQHLFEVGHTMSFTAARTSTSGTRC